MVYQTDEEMWHGLEAAGKRMKELEGLLKSNLNLMKENVLRSDVQSREEGRLLGQLEWVTGRRHSMGENAGELYRVYLMARYAGVSKLPIYFDGYVPLNVTDDDFLPEKTRKRLQEMEYAVLADVTE